LQAKEQVAMALRVFVDPANLPVLVHCVHGKDRTGLIIALLLLLLGVNEEMVRDFSFSYHCRPVVLFPCFFFWGGGGETGAGTLYAGKFLEILAFA
jgi:Tyrosine phosphatase family